MRGAKLAACLAVVLFVGLSALPEAYADEALGDVDAPRASAAASADAAGGDGSGVPEEANATQDVSGVEVSKEGDAALVEGAPFGVSDFSRAQKGSNRDIEGAYYGYSYIVGKEQGAFVQIIAADDYAVVYVPEETLQELGLDVADAQMQTLVRQSFTALDDLAASGSARLADIETWHFTSDTSYDVDGVSFVFDQLIGGSVYASVIGEDGADLTAAEGERYLKPSFADFGRLTAADGMDIVAAPTGLAALADFFSTLDWSPLWVSLRTTGIALAIIFVLGLAAAYFCLNVSRRAKNFFDVVFTIPMVLPPTVCGFILLWLCGTNTAFGQFWIDVGFPLIFSPVACVIAAVVVAFPLMYRNALGAFEGLDPNMLDAARTLGWSNARIFLRLMLPLSWSSIAAGTMLAFARALGEFGATLFLAGNYLGVTRTIPIAIYFEWMNGNDEVAWFWTAVIIAFSFVVILLINVWTSRTTKYRRRVEGS